ncbi:MAG: hypothetical protein HDS66_03050 [Bacteroidales bacterium]|nr:hypothetical protein [Bacteroidales bacterium]
MSVILSYSDNTTGTGWIPKEPYSGDDIRKINDPNGDTVEHPRTAIPSPFAQVDLVLTAFETLASEGLTTGAAMHHRLVSDALDVAQILFDYPNHARNLRILRWNPESALAAMARGSEAHRLLADTLRLYMEGDDRAYNFSSAGDWYILMSQGRVIGSTSPATLTMGAPGIGQVDEIMVEQNRPLFGEPRHLWERDEEFVIYLIHWFNAYPQLRTSLRGVYDYILANIKEISRRKPQLYSRILSRVENPTALNLPAAQALADAMLANYSEPAASMAPRIFGVSFFTRKTDDILRSPKESDFRLKPLIEQPASSLPPLILREGFTPPGAEDFRYISQPWQPGTVVRTGGVAPEERTLPDTSIVYPWLTSCDLLEDTLIRLATPVAPQFFTAMSGGPDTLGCLLPVKPLFFRYFPASYLRANVVPGKPVMELREEGCNVVAVLRLPTKGGYVELQRIYRPGVTADPEGDGAIFENARISAAVFPFARTGEQDIYNVRLFEMMPDYRSTLSFFGPDPEHAVEIRDPFVRTRSRVMRTSYYEVDDTWDYARVDIVADNGASAPCGGVILPCWPEYNAGSDEFTFAVDFGTTNSHVEYCIGDNPPRPLTFDAGREATLVATLDAPGTLAQADTLLDVEFVPRNIGEEFGFPMRTALSRNATTDAHPEALRSVNIPFLYERKPFNGYRVSTMLKWGAEQEEAEQFLREIMLLLRARIILSNGSPARSRLIYFYPVSMKRSLQHRYLTLWEDLYARYLNPADIKVQALPESVAPAYFYHNASTEGSDYASIDIGGGSSDVVIYKADEERMRSHPEIIASFRFAGNSLFGDAFTHADAASNPMIQKYVAYFSKLLGSDPQLSFLDAILSDILTTGRSEDINAFLFSVEQTPALRKLRELDRRPFSYNSLLSDDAGLKIVFLYFYAALIYYVAQLMKQAGIGLPRRICFSGTGSKILNILGRHDTVEEFTEAIIEKVYGERYKAPHRFELMIERAHPKQVTCKGGLELERRIGLGETDRSPFSARNIMAHKTQYSLTSVPEYTYASVRTTESRAEIVQAVEDFNAFFLSMMQQEWGEEFGVSREAVEKFRSEASRDIPNYLASGIRTFLPESDAPDERVEDVPFFYAITGIIRNTLIPLFA